MNWKTGVLLILLMLTARPADAAFHLMSIREVYAGSLANPDSQYVMLQLRANNQNQLGGHSIIVYDAAGTEIRRFTFASAVSNGQNQAFVLIATPAAVSEFGVSADLTMDPVLARAGGRVCFDNVDCFAWGQYSGSPTVPCAVTSPSNCQTGTPFRASEGLAPGRAASRQITANNPVLLETADDTGSSQNDFRYAPDPQPSNNAGAVASLPAAGSGLQFLDFTDTTDLGLQGELIASAGDLQLPAAIGAESSGAVWHRLRQSVGSGFQTRFRFKAGASTAGARPEGFSFVVQNESNSSLGKGGSSLGYDGVTNGVAVEFDLLPQPSPHGDPSAAPGMTHISVHSSGAFRLSASESTSLASIEHSSDLADGRTHTVLIDYVPGNPGILSVYVDDLLTPVLQTSLNLSSLLDLTNGNAFVGFTAGSRSDAPAMVLRRWELGSSLPPDCREGELQFRLVQSAITEGGTRGVQVERVGGSCGAVAVPYSLSGGTASAGEDFTGGSGTLRWPDGVSGLRGFSLPTADDPIDEPTESATLSLGSPQGGARLAERVSHTVLIRDNDAPPVVSISTPAFASEGTVDVFFTLTLDRPSASEVSVGLLLGGTAVKGSDYLFSAPRVYFPPGETVITRSLDATRRDIVRDSVSEPDETIELTLDRPSRASLATERTGVITIPAH